MNSIYNDSDASASNAFEPEDLPSTPRRPRRRVMAETAPTAPTITVAPARPFVSQPEQQRRQPQPTAQRPAPKDEPSKPKARVNIPAEPKAPGAIRKFFADGRHAIFGGIICLIAAMYVGVAFISFFATAGADDQSIIHSAGFEGAREASATISNAAGPLGAWLSEALINNGFGLGAVMIPAYLAILGLGLVGLRRLHFWSLTAKSLITMVAVSIVVGMVTFNMTTGIFWGGRHGHDINELLIQTTGVWGMIGVSLILVAGVVLIFLKQLTDSAAAVGAFVERRREAARERREAAAAAREAAREAAASGRRTSAKAEPEDADEPEAPDEAAADPIDSFIDDSAEAPAEAAAGPDHEAEPEQVTFGAADDPLAELDDVIEGEPAATAALDVTPAISVAPAIARADEGGTEITVETSAPIEAAASAPALDHYDPTAELPHFRKPSLDLLIDRPATGAVLNEDEQNANINNIRRVLSNFGIDIAKITATVGPTVTLYEIVPAEGVRINKIRSLEDDIALSLSAIGIRIIAPMPGKGTIGIEVPNTNPQVVSIRSILASRKYQESKAELPMAMGATISNDVYIADLTKMPHLLVAGSTGMGKSVGLNTIIASILYKKHPAEVKFVLIDPKMVEFSLYNMIERHYLAKLPDQDEAIITKMDLVVPTLLSLCIEMDNRYELLKAANCRAIKEYNEKFVNLRLSPAKGHRYMPYIVVVIDEFADLIMTAGKEVETPIARIAQKARAVGIHIILATQRPSANIITGVIRANFPGRIAFRVTQQLESRIILDRPGANQLIGRGDMLFSRDGIIDRVQCAFIDTPEVEAICDSIASQVGYDSAYELPEYVPPTGSGEDGASGGVSGDRDPLFEAAARLIIEENVGSTSLVQRRLEIGYPRAAKIMEQLERAGIVGPAQGGKPRKVNMTMMDFEQWLACTGTTQYQPLSGQDD